MSQYRLVKGIKEQEELRQSFNQLAEDTFKEFKLPLFNHA